MSSRAGTLFPDSREGLRGRMHTWWQNLRRLAPADHGRVTLRQRRIYILPTRRGAVFLFTVGVMLLVSLNYAISLGLVITFLWFGVIAATLAHTFRNLFGLTIAPVAAGHAFAGGTLPFTVSIDSGRNARERLVLSLEGQAAVEIDVPAAAVRSVILTRITQRRGRLPMGRITVASEAPLGLWRAWSYVHFPLQGLVFPAPEIEPPPLPQGSSIAHGEQSGRVGAEDLAGLRDYQPGDPLQRVAWKAVARGAGWYSKAFEGGQGRQHIALDFSALPSMLDVEARLSRLTAWVLVCEREGRPFAFTLPGATLALQKGTAHCEAALTQLALFRSDADLRE